MLRTARHLRLRQIAALLRRRLPAPLPAASRGAEPFEPPRLLPAPAPAEPFDPALRTFRFQNEGAEFEPGRIDWSGGGRSPLWAYHLHYHDALGAESVDPAAAAVLLEDWIAHAQPGSAPGWDPYPISLRAVNWIRFLARSGDAIAPALRGAIARSLQHQGRVLASRLEYPLLANHLFENAKALVFLGAAFRGRDGDRWWRRGLRLLAREVREQVLPDGGHYEESHAYHAIILLDMLELIDLLRATDRRAPAEIIDLVRDGGVRMVEWHSAMLHADGEVALFNDSGMGIARPAAGLAAYASALDIPMPAAPEGISNLDGTRYHILREAPLLLIFDGGGTGPSCQPGHHHSDALSFEMDLGGRRVIVDRGTFGYAGSPGRLETRRSCSHNTVTAGGADHSEVWDSFRVARRMRPLGVAFAGRRGDEVEFRGQVRAFPALGYGIHERAARIRTNGDRGIIVVEDQLRGLGARDLDTRIHFHPDCRVKMDGACAVADAPEWRITVRAFGSAHLAAEPYEFHPAHGIRRPATRILVSDRGEAVAYEIEWGRRAV